MSWLSQITGINIDIGKMLGIKKLTQKVDAVAEEAFFDLVRVNDALDRVKQKVVDLILRSEQDFFKRLAQEEKAAGVFDAIEAGASLRDLIHSVFAASSVPAYILVPYSILVDSIEFPGADTPFEDFEVAVHAEIEHLVAAIMAFKFNG